MARLAGVARQGAARHGAAGLAGEAWQGLAGLGKAWVARLVYLAKGTVMVRRSCIFTKAELRRLAAIAAETGQPIWLKRGDTTARADPPGSNLQNDDRARNAKGYVEEKLASAPWAKLS
jgi:hypothetical protein